MLVCAFSGLEAHAAPPMRMRSRTAIASTAMATPACCFPRSRRSHERRLPLRHRGDGRRGAHAATIATPRGKIRTPAFMPVGTAATVKAMYPEAGAGARRRYRARQHLSSDAAPRRGAHRGARRPASLHELAASDPHRFRRLSGHVARQAAQARRERRHLPVAYRRRAPCADAGALDGDPAPARLRHSDAVRRMRQTALFAEDEAERAMRLSLRWAERSRKAFGDAAGPRLFRHRAGRRGAGAAHRERAGAGRYGFRRPGDRRPRGRRAAGGHAGDDRDGHAASAARTSRVI